jgi:hypothetical protein
MHYSSRDLMAAKIEPSRDRGPREIIYGSAYLPYDDFEPPTPREMEKLVAGRRADGSHLVTSCDMNAHHTTWDISNINDRGESLFNFLMANDLDVMNLYSLHPNH